MKWFVNLLFVFFITACSEQPSNSNQKGTGESANNTSVSQSKVTVLCRCGERYISWSGKDESSAKEQVKKNCESLSQSIGKCEVRK